MPFMNTKRIIFWVSFIIILGLIIWGLVVAMNKPPVTAPELGTPAPVTSADHVRGPENAPVTIIEYSDFECPACAAYYPVVEKLVAEASTTVRFVYRHFPLYPLPHKNAFIASQASEAAALQGKFWEMYTLLFDNQTEWAGTNKAESIFEGYATRIGLNVEAYKKDFASEAVEARIDKDKTEAQSLHVNATPTFFVNGKAIANPQGYEQFKTIIEAAASSTAN